MRTRLFSEFAPIVVDHLPVRHAAYENNLMYEKINKNLKSPPLYIFTKMPARQHALASFKSRCHRLVLLDHYPEVFSVYGNTPDECGAMMAFDPLYASFDDIIFGYGEDDGRIQPRHISSEILLRSESVLIFSALKLEDHDERVNPLAFGTTTFDNTKQIGMAFPSYLLKKKSPYHEEYLTRKFHEVSKEKEAIRQSCWVSLTSILIPDDIYRLIGERNLPSERVRNNEVKKQIEGIRLLKNQLINDANFTQYILAHRELPKSIDMHFKQLMNEYGKELIDINQIKQTYIALRNEIKNQHPLRASLSEDGWIYQLFSTIKKLALSIMKIKKREIQADKRHALVMAGQEENTDDMAEKQISQKQIASVKQTGKKDHYSLLPAHSVLAPKSKAHMTDPKPPVYEARNSFLR